MHERMGITVFHLCAEPDVSMFLNWAYDDEERWSDGSVGSTWCDQPALAAVGAQVKDSAGPPLLRTTRR